MTFSGKLEIADSSVSKNKKREIASANGCNGTIKKKGESSSKTVQATAKNVKAKTQLKERKQEKKVIQADNSEKQTSQREEFSSTEVILEDKKRKNERRYTTCWTSLASRIARIFDHPWLPSGKTIAHWMALILVGFSLWGIIYAVAEGGFIPGSQLFSLAVLFVVAYLAGELVKFIKIPPLLGMLLTGILLRNVGFIHLSGVYMEVTASLREMALCIILIRAGLGLDPSAMKTLSFVILRLAAIPALVEGTITMIMTHLLLGLPWIWGALLGAVLAAVSPAVVIPCLFSLQERGYGTDKGIPTLVVAAASLDDIISISVFGVVVSIIFTTGTSLTMQIVQGPLGVVIGIAFGIVWGFIAHYVPHKKDDRVVLLRVLMIAGGGLMAIFGGEAIGFQGAGPLGCIVAAFVACLGWRKEGWSDENNPVADAFSVIWTVFQPILFGLIGSEVDVFVLEGSTVGYGILSLLCSLMARILISIFVAFGAGFNWKEKVFIAWAWFPKATVQAALGPLALDLARSKDNPDPQEIQYAGNVLILAVLAILITAPIGATLITILGPRLLTKTENPNNLLSRKAAVSKKEDKVNLEAREDERSLNT